MKRTILFIMLTCGFSISLVAQDSKNILVDIEWLKGRIDDKNLVMFHIGREDKYKSEHIPGAVFMPGRAYTYGDDTHSFDLPEVSVLKELFETKGVNDGSTVVIYAGENWASMVTRLYFTFDYLGFEGDTHILDGSMVDWKAAGGEVTNEIAEIAAGSVTLNVQNQLLADRDHVLSSLDNSSVNIVDGRAQVYYNGIEAGNGGKSRKGHIKGAKSIPYTSLADDTDKGGYKFKTTDQLSAIFREQNLVKDQELILYCHIGMQLTMVYTAAKILGYENIRVYDGSFYEWGPDESLPIDSND